MCVLLWFGIRALVGRHRPAAEPEKPTAGSGFRAGLLTNLANPKLAVFAISFLPQFVPPGSDRWTLLLLGAIIAWLKRAEVRRRLERISGAVLIGLGIKLAVFH